MTKQVTPKILRKAKEYGFSDRQLAHLWHTNEDEIRALRKRLGILPVYKTVDTCAAEFEASTPYHYSTYEQENESIRSTKRKVIILGGGPNRIGQGIEFDYCCVHGVQALREEGIEAILVNCNPETVSTDYDTTDKLYFEPLTLEDVLHICDHEQPDGVIVSFGGQTPLKLAIPLEQRGVKIIGTSPTDIDRAEDRKLFGELLKKLKIPHPDYGTASTVEEAVTIANGIGYPTLVRPSYVLGGRAMEICYHEKSLREYMKKAVDVSPEHPVLIDRFLEDAFEYDVDAISDGKDVVIGAVMEHVEEAGIHSGDSACTLPPVMISPENLDILIDYTKRLALGLQVKGLMNVQYAMKNDIVYVLEANPRASRTVPFVGKAVGIPLAKYAAKVMVGRTLCELGILDFDFRNVKHISMKESVFPFSKFPTATIFLGPEMRSTGEVMGIADNFGEAVAKASMSAGNTLPNDGTVFISVNQSDKNRITINIARSFVGLGFTFVGTEGTAKFLEENGIACDTVFKVNEDRPNVVDFIKNGKIQFIINTPLGETSRYDEFAIGRAAIQNKIAYVTTLSAAETAVRGILRQRTGRLGVKSIQEYHRSK